MKNKFITLLLTGVVFVGMLTACSNAQTSQNVEEEKSVSESNTSNTSDFDTDKYIINQNEAVKIMGLESAPVSAVSIGLSSSLIALESGINIIGIPNNHHLPEEYLETVSLITNDKGDVDWNLIKELAPSVIIVDEISQTKLAAELAELNIPLYTISITTYESTFTEIGVLGSAFGSNDTAKITIENYIERIEDMLGEIKDIPEKSLAIAQLTDDGLMIYTGGTYANELLETVKIKNTAEVMNIPDTTENGGTAKIEISDLMNANPDSIAIIAKGVSEDVYNALMAEFAKEEYKNVNAVKNSSIEKVDHHQFMVRGILGINGMETAFKLAYE
ncbi:ABC transporter substrate-binding protein [Clostridium grantii]|uniref:ABC-type Fe3+-hydroxamate transport system, substrate-binding protein n=1 Tax=Clostridium grantii DSM 8605 TaxID=1121316 RepID=A0A1M5XWG2_9CLOT|nr:ABC transporter substrate-binding protein [Clostridium grantii]SHI04140.1 ABC-type Fe3+-hydroxamate transport system, substrate-binding protein [Clostridium grantii DSM 8605]